jgi:uncharacterized protein YcaQ
MPTPCNPSLTQLRRYAVARSLFKPTSLPKALAHLAFVQADPIRAPARAQDLILRHRVEAYQAGDLEGRYAALDVEEDFFVNYGFVTPALQALLHPRTAKARWTRQQQTMADEIVEFVAANGPVHPRQVDAHFAHGRTTNWFGGNSKVSTQMLDDLHYRGLLRVARRDNGTRVYASPHRPHASSSHAPETVDATLDALVDAIVALYAPLPLASLRQLMGLLKNGVPQWHSHMPAALVRARLRLAHTTLDGTQWLWPAHENPLAQRWQGAGAKDDTVRLLAPFDPVVWDRRRFALFWNWEYKFEAYTPPAKRVRGYYAMPLLWRDEVIGWGNLAVKDGALQVDLGYVKGTAPRDAAYTVALQDELAAMRGFLRVDGERLGLAVPVPNSRPMGQR